MSMPIFQNPKIPSHNAKQSKLSQPLYTSIEYHYIYQTESQYFTKISKSIRDYTSQNQLVVKTLIQK